MGKTLEALKRLTIRPVKPPVDPGEPRGDKPEPSANGEEIPFIEVGGPRKAIEGSRDVMACPAPAARLPQAPAAKLEPATEPGNWTVQFRPLAREGSSLARKPQPLAAELIAFHQPEHAISAQYRTLLAGLLGQLPSGWGQVLLFTAPAPWAGTTTVLLNLALTAARQEGRKIAVVDANLRRPVLADRLGIVPTPGLRDVLAGSVSLRSGFQETAQANLWALPAGRTNLGDVRLPLDWLMPTLRQLRQHFDLVFVDAPSWNEGSEVSALAATCDAVYMVLHQGQASAENRANPLPLLRQPPTNLQGCILTMR